jgi:hypothetical protein
LNPRNLARLFLDIIQATVFDLAANWMGTNCLKIGRYDSQNEWRLHVVPLLNNVVVALAPLAGDALSRRGTVFVLRTPIMMRVTS